jgi:hypothetical protein
MAAGAQEMEGEGHPGRNRTDGTEDTKTQALKIKPAKK